MVEDALGLVILIIVTIVFAVLGGLSVLFSFDIVASTVSWVGLGPGVGWAMLGAIGGGLFGVVQGIKSRGKSDDLRRVYSGAAVVLVLLLAFGATSPAGRALIGW